MTAVANHKPLSGEEQMLALAFRRPARGDAIKVSRLIATCPPLDENSLYCTLLQCTDFASTCMLALRDGEIIGWVSGYRPPDEPTTLFIWQVAISGEARGLGIGKALVANLLAADGAKGVERLRTTITKGNEPSWAMFRAIAADLKASLTDEEWFRRDHEFAGRHDTEFLVTIGPLGAARRSTADQK